MAFVYVVVHRPQVVQKRLAWRGLEQGAAAELPEAASRGRWVARSRAVRCLQPGSLLLCFLWALGEGCSSKCA